MTLMAFHVTADQATIVGDSLFYTPTGRRMAYADKHESVDAECGVAVLAKGEGALSTRWRRRAMRWARRCDIDELNRCAVDRLPALWQAVQERLGWAPTPTTIVQIGYSHQAGRWKACGFQSWTGFAPVDLSDMLYVAPNPNRSAAPGTEVGDFAVSTAVHPTSDAGWADLATTVRAERALAYVNTGAKVFVGGDVVRARLDGDGVDRQVIHRFDDTGEEFRHMVLCTDHPVGQLSPCPCASGRRFVDCHALAADDACRCGSGHTFGACCRLDPDSDEARRWLDSWPGLDEPTRYLLARELADVQWARAETGAQPAPATAGAGAKVGRNDPCPCGSGVKHKKCCLTGAAAQPA